ncbi:MAG: twin-arginine translocase TatA/TatE family subunit [Deinococcales bacterium]
MRIGSLGLPELLIILLVVLLIFGPRRLPEMAKGLGQSVREFRKGVKDMKEDFEAEANDDGSKAAPSKATAAKDAAAKEAPVPAEAASASAPAEAATAPAVDGAAKSDAKPKEA